MPNFKIYFEFNRISYDFIVKIYSIIYGLSVAFMLVYDLHRIKNNGEMIREYLILSISMFSIFSIYFFIMLYKSENCKKNKSIPDNSTPLSRRTAFLFFEIGGSAILASFLSFAFFGIQNYKILFDGSSISYSAKYMMWNCISGVFLLVLSLWFASEERKDYEKATAIAKNTDKNIVDSINELKKETNDAIAALDAFLEYICKNGLLISIIIGIICSFIMIYISTNGTFSHIEITSFEFMVIIGTILHLSSTIFSAVSKS